MNDLRLAVRGLWRAKAFSAAAVLTLAVGIAGTSAMFALIQGVLLRPLPVHDEDRLLVAWKSQHGSGHWPFETKDLEALRDGSRLLSGVAGVGYYGALAFPVVENGNAGTLRIASITGDFFDVLGVQPALGRTLRRADDLKGAERAVVLSHGLWQRRYGGRADVIGRRIVVQQQPFAIVGVMPPDFDLPRTAEAWMSVAAVESIATNSAFKVSVDVVTRMRDGVTIQQAVGELGTLVAQLDAKAAPGQPQGLEITARSYKDMVVGDMRTTVIVSFGAVALVLLIASANVANLLLLRGEARRSDMAVRTALGASRWALLRHVLTESTVIALGAGAAGLALAWWILQTVFTLVPGSLARAESVRMDGAVMLFGIGVAFATASLAGLTPAMAAARADIVSQLRRGTRGVTKRATRGSRGALVVAQVALAIATVAAAGVLARTVLSLQATGTALSVERLVLVPLELPQPKYADRDRHLRFLVDAIATLEGSPGVQATTPVNTAPLSGSGWDAKIVAEGQSAADAAANPLLNLESIHANYFDTLDVAIVRGRPFTLADRDGAPDVAIVSEDVASRIWPGQDPIGRRLRFEGNPENNPWRTVVGVARPTRYRELTEPRATMYLPAEQFLVTAQMLVVRTVLPLDSVARVSRERIRAIDPDVQVLGATSFIELLERPLARPRFGAALVTAFGLAGLLLAGVGLYAVMSALVRQRHREIGIRLALGARASDVRRLVMGESVRLTAIGAIVGLTIAFATAPLLRGVIYGVNPVDPASLVGAAILLLGVSALATYLPTRWATKVDPIATLRAE